MRGVRVIPFSNILNREVRTSAYFPTHNQKFKKVEDFYKLWDFTIENQKTVDAGMEVDTILVLNGDFPFPTHHESKNGHFITLRYDNSGQSWGAFNLAFQTFKDKYDYWLFSEDDLIILGDGYFKKCVDRFHSEDNVGFVALSGVNKTHPNPHAHCGTGLTSTAVLRDVCSNNGGNLPYPEKVKRHRDAIEEGEIPFTNQIHKLGYKLIEYGTREWGEHNLIIPYYDLCKK
jgi:hypothetical protein